MQDISILAFPYGAEKPLLNYFRLNFTHQKNLTGFTSNELTDITGCIPPCSYYEYTEVDREEYGDWGGLGRGKYEHLKNIVFFLGYF